MMARASFIYLIETMTGRTIAAFTVKHECKSFIEDHIPEDVRKYHSMISFRDGTNEEVKNIPLEDFLNE